MNRTSIIVEGKREDVSTHSTHLSFIQVLMKCFNKYIVNQVLDPFLLDSELFMQILYLDLKSIESNIYLRFYVLRKALETSFTAIVLKINRRLEKGIIFREIVMQ